MNETLKQLITNVYNSAYQHGHEDTVESQFTLVHYSDRNFYHREEAMEVVGEFLADTICSETHISLGQHRKILRELELKNEALKNENLGLTNKYDCAVTMAAKAENKLDKVLRELRD